MSSWLLAALLFAGLTDTGCVSGVGPQLRERSQKQYELAVGLQAEGDQTGAFKTLHRALEMDPENVKAHQLLANLYLVYRGDNIERYDKLADTHFRAALKTEEALDNPDTALLADIYNGLGVLRIHQAAYQDAVTALTRAVEVEPFNSGAYMAWGNLGWAHQETGNLEAAQAALVKAVRLNGGFCVGHYRLGMVYLAQKAFEQAEQALTQAIEAHESCDAFQEAWHLRGEAKMNLGHREDARGDFERCVELAPKTDAGTACRRYLEATY